MTDVVHYAGPRGADPPPEYTTYREHGTGTRVVLPSGRTAWLVTRYEDARAALRDPALSSNSGLPGYPLLGAGVEVPPFNATLIGLDGPAHARLRGLMAADFSRRRAIALRPEIQRLAELLADRMATEGPPSDLVSGFAQPLATQTTCVILGVPYAEHDFFEHHTLVATDGSSSTEQKSESITAVLGLLRRLIDAKTEAPADDLISRLAATGQLSTEELLFNVALVLGAGIDTTANMIALGTMVLLRHPTQWAAIRTAPGLAANAVDELLRYLTIVRLGLARVAVADTTIGGNPIRAGDGVIISLLAANRDGDAFPSPDTVDVHRQGAQRHVAFGHGIHQCIGQSFARIELEVAVSVLATRFPALRITVADEELRFRDTSDFYGLRELPLAW